MRPANGAIMTLDELDSWLSSVWGNKHNVQRATCGMHTDCQVVRSGESTRLPDG